MVWVSWIALVFLLISLLKQKKGLGELSNSEKDDFFVQGNKEMFGFSTTCMSAWMFFMNGVRTLQ